MLLRREDHLRGVRVNVPDRMANVTVLFNIQVAVMVMTTVLTVVVVAPQYVSYVTVTVPLTFASSMQDC